MSDLNGKTALVTGGSRGIGAAVAVALAERGADVAVTYLQAADEAAAITSKVEAYGGRGLAIQADAADAEALAAAVARAEEELGGLDILVNNAGVGTTGPLTDVPLAEVDRVLAINVRAAYVASQAAASRLRDGGRIVHIGSCISNRATGPGMTLYAMSKTALIGLNKGLARDLAERGITSNVVNPGPTDTAMNPADGPYAQAQRAALAIDRFGSPAEVAAAVVFLAGPDASYLTGSELTIDGGHSA
ncbi:SDR family NAD(P)-dependent oxidoreductase [Kribbella deserti]|uniref:SDR family NAD(P)-dependent oxidoreductase n=1 Tax=Kribbella deserti TaxID=1926257 RepID=A0ABV6QW87_9ACTN